MKKYSQQDQRSMAAWAADCAERVLPFFENAYPKDNRPRKAIEACRLWVDTGVFKMADIRGASLAAHAEVRAAEDRNWQTRRLPDNLRQEIMPKLIIQKRGNRIVINLRRGEGFKGFTVRSGA
jgi:hypothetical protein